jgi:RNA polymerase sigma factor (sigma-70 family)
MTGYSLTEAQKNLILDNRAPALRIARSLLRRWNLFFDISEAQSIADMALCEAARNFDFDRGTRFITYLFPFIKGSLIAEMKRSRGDRAYGIEHIKDSGFESHDSYREHTEVGLKNEYDSIADQGASPEELSYHQEIKVICQKALDSLLPLERDTIVGVDIMGDKVAQFARKIGYSRPYLSSIRSKAIVKMQPYFDKLAA